VGLCRLTGTFEMGDPFSLTRCRRPPEGTSDRLLVADVHGSFKWGKNQLRAQRGLTPFRIQKWLLTPFLPLLGGSEDET
jgi:hypothetical protein